VGFVMQFSETISIHAHHITGRSVYARNWSFFAVRDSGRGCIFFGAGLQSPVEWRKMDRQQGGKAKRAVKRND
jgi:hypothetical protein